MMKSSLAFLIITFGFLVIVSVDDIMSQKLVKGNGNIRVTKTCGSGRKKSASELKEMERRAIEKSRKKKQIEKGIKAEIQQNELYFMNTKGFCPRNRFPKFIAMYLKNKL